MKVTGARSVMLEIPLGRHIADSKRAVSQLQFVGLLVDTDEGHRGTGYTVTVGFGGSVIREVLDSLFIEELIGRDPFDVREIWRDLYQGCALWIGRAGATTMAQAAVDIALWDIVAKACDRPLWQVLGGGRAADVPIYNTHAGWLNYSLDQLRQETSTLIDQGYRALKMKVGLDDLDEDLRRVDALRRHVPDDVLLMVDANQAWDLMQATRALRRLGDLDLAWVEEPMHPDDVRAHACLRAESRLPIALGEHVYTTQAFHDFIERRAVDVVQVDVCRVGGVTPWLEVAAVANAANLRVCPHAGDLMQVHQHLVKAIPNHWLLEVIPLWEESPFCQPVRLEHGVCRTPWAAGASTEFTNEALEAFAVH